MRHWQGRRYWIVGASAGLGRAVARQISATGAHVILSARSEDDLKSLASEIPGPSTVLPMDISDNDSVANAAKKAGRVDGLVLLAGVYWPLSASEWNGDKITAMLDINLTGAARVLGHIVPQMVERDSGHVVLTGSLSGYRGLPGSIGYSASKSGLMHLAECMHADLKKTGVDVQLVNPGFVKTRLTEKNDFKMPFIMEPEEAAREFIDHMNDDTFAKNFPRAFATMFRLGNFLPDWLYYRISS